MGSRIFAVGRRDFHLCDKGCRLQVAFRWIYALPQEGPRWKIEEQVCSTLRVGRSFCKVTFCPSFCKIIAVLFSQIHL